MSENNNDILFNFEVPYNNETFFKYRKKANKKSLIGNIIAFLLFSFMFAISITLNIEMWVKISSLIAPGIFAILIVSNIRDCIYSPKNNNILVKYYFTKNGLKISKNSRKNENEFKITTACLYRSYKNAQYITKVYENADSFTFKICVGSYNLIPQYNQEILPKDVFKSKEQLNLFTDFIKEMFKKDFK